MQQTMMRVKDPKKSLRFYTEVLGMRYDFIVNIYHLVHLSQYDDCLIG